MRLMNLCTDWSRDWQFSKDQKSWEVIDAPHTCNTVDGMSEQLFRGVTCYQKKLILSPSQRQKSFALLFHAVGQKSEIQVNDTTVMTYEGGYTPFVVPLTNLQCPGENLIKVFCNNEPNADLIPMSADFNFNNGLHEKVFLYELDKLYFDIYRYGYDRFHVIPQLVTNQKADIVLQSMITNLGEKSTYCQIHYTFRAAGKEVLSGTQELIASPGGNTYEESITLYKPRLWNGLIDPFLYTVELELIQEGQLIDTAQTRIGLRYFGMDYEKGFLLNGQPYSLRGVAMHQDAPNVMSAMKERDFDRDYEMIQELGCTFLRLAHYTHDAYAFRKCDELGLIVQTEIPWVNHLGPKASQKYHDCIQNNLQSMITNYYNHSSIIFWGICNELNGSHWKTGEDPQGGFSSELAIEWVNEFYDYAKTLDATRYIGFTSHDDTFIGSQTADWHADFIASNQYKGWYGGTFPEFGAKMDQYRQEDAAQFWCVGEYGAGNNPWKHSSNPMATTEIATGGQRHDEEFANLFHESYLAQIKERPWLIYTSVWILFDFAVASRFEGETPYQNDKGMVTRDRQTKKDIYYLYQAAWSKKPVVYITGKRFDKRQEEMTSIKVYSNATKLSLYQNDKLLQTLEKSDVADVVWNFENITLAKEGSEFKVIGTFKDGVQMTDRIVINKKSIGN